MKSAALTAPVTRAIRRVKGVVNGSKLKAALAEVSRLEQARQEIQREIDAQIDTSRFQQAVEKARARFESEKTVDSEIKLILTQLAAAEADRRVQPMRYARLRYGSDGGAFAEWLRKTPQWRSILETACRIKLELAKAEHENISATVRQQLGDGFDSDDLEAEPRVKRARRETERWGGLLAGIARADPAEAWPRYVRCLLSK